jgi:PAS domain S-box-containing protein
MANGYMVKIVWRRRKTKRLTEKSNVNIDRWNQPLRRSIRERIRLMKRSLLIWILFIVVLTAPLLHAAQATVPSGHATARQEILILNSYHPGYAWSDDEQAGVIDVCRAKDEKGFPVIEYLDLRRLPDGKYLAELKNLFRIKYQNRKFSVIVAIDNPALEFAIDNQVALFKNAPIVFCGINNYTPSLLKGHTNVTGIVEAVDIAGTIEVMLHLHPDAREIFCLNDYTSSGLAVRKELEALVLRFGPRVRFRFTDPLTMDELLKELERLPKNSLVFMAAFITDKSGHTFDVSETTELFFKHSPVPIYSIYEQRLGSGIVGGKLLRARMHGADAARIALRVLAGEKASAIPVVLKSDAQFMFDYKVMRRFGIPLSALPEGSTLINKPVSFYATHRVVIQTASGIIVFMATVIFLLTINIIQRRRSAVALRASEAKYYDLYENAPDMYFSVDVKTATITECNNTLVEALGYSREEIIGRSMFEIHHPDGREEAKRVFQEFCATGEVRGAERMIRRKDGSIIHVSLNASAARDKQGNITHSRSVWRDITIRKRAEEALRESDERFRCLSAAAFEAIIIHNGGILLSANDQYYEMFGYEPEELMGKQALPLTVSPETIESLRKEIATGGLGPYEAIGLKKDGTQFPIEIRVREVKYGGRKVRVAALMDITERKQLEEALRRSEENFHRSFDDSPLGVRIVTAKGETIYANRAMLDIYGYDSLEELNVTPIQMRYTSESHAEFQIRREKRKRGDDVPPEYEVSIIKKSDEVRRLQVFRKSISWNGERQFQVIYNDITDRKEAEEALRTSREQMRALAGRLQAVREEERTKVSREIHDELGGALTGLKIDFSFLTRSALKITNDAVRTSLLSGMDSAMKFIDATIQTVRRIAMELRPGVLDDLGLIAALEWQLNDFQKRTNIRAKWISSIEYINLDTDLSTALFRIVQEALTNVARHSGATEVCVHLRAEADSFILEIKDNGRGIEKEKPLSSKSLGLLGMRERAQICGGRVTVKGTPGKGTKVTVEILPVEKRKRDRELEGDAG